MHYRYTMPLTLTWLGDIAVRTLDLKGPGFDFWSGRYQVVTTWMGDCLWTVNHRGT